MTETWFSITARERALVLDALAALRDSAGAHAEELDALSTKVRLAEPHPSITVGVYGGLVQWTLGNPFPIRVCDYDGEQDELPDLDERGQRCRMWFEPASTERPNRRTNARNGSSTPRSVTEDGRLA